MILSIEQITFWLIIADIALVAIAVIHMLYQRRTPQSQATWLLTLLLLPYLGVILYFFFGLRKSISKSYKTKITIQPLPHNVSGDSLITVTDNILKANQIPGTTHYNQVQLCHNDCQRMQLLMQHIEKAEKQIHIETYIFEADQTGSEIIEALTQKARQGVEVRLLMDAIGSFKLYLNRSPLKQLKQAGAKYAFFQPIWPDILTNQINLRNHRKIYLFDQKTLLTGGLNLSDDYLLETNHTEQSSWVDLMLKITGPATFHYQNIFNADWFYSSKEKLSEPRVPHGTQSGEETVQVIPAGPDIENEALLETLLNNIYQTKHQIQISTPYFIPNSSIMNALLIALKRGVKVTLLTPEKSDHLIFDLGRSSYMRELIEAGGEVHYYPNGMLHAKLVIFDDRVAMTGSANIDYRSLFINYEIVNYIHSKDTIQELHKWFLEHLNKSYLYKPNPSRLSRFLENLTRIIAPIL